MFTMSGFAPDLNDLSSTHRLNDLVATIIISAFHERSMYDLLSRSFASDHFNESGQN